MRGLNVLFLQAGFQSYDDGHNDECCADVRHINPEIAVLPQSGVIFVCSQLWISTVYIYIYIFMDINLLMSTSNFCAFQKKT